MRSHRTRRRRVLRLAGLAATAALAGCGDGGSNGGDGGDSDDGGGGGYGGGGGEDSGDGDDGGTGSDGDSDDGGGDASADGAETATPTAAPAETPGTDELDLREANVLSVAFDGSDGSYEFTVELHHDDDGEEGYANWWQVERLDGTRLGRRDLAHPHSNQPFTRSSRSPFDVPAEVTCVVVRGHDQTHGYGGRAVLVNLDSGATRGVMQGTDPQSFDADDCP